MASAASSICPGCRVALVRRVRSGLEGDDRVGASVECWRRYLDATAFELAHVAVLGGFHQLLVDAYIAQHPDPPTKPIGITFALVGLCLALERGCDGLAVRRVHQAMAARRRDWPVIRPPPVRGELTVDDLARAGADEGDPEAHARVLHAWASAVWHAWRSGQADVRTLAASLVDRARERGHGR